MTDRVLSDNELKGVALGAWHSSTVPYPFNFLEVARAVEAAALAKCTKFTDGSYAIFRDGCEAKVTEREARTRERAAWVACVAFTENIINKSGKPWRVYASEEGDRRYPLPACDKCGQVLP